MGKDGGPDDELLFGPEDGAVTAVRPQRPSGSPWPILVVDDDADMLRLLSLRLKAAGHDVVAVGSAEAALAQLDIARPQL
ncbi:hypothetical protein ABTC76_21125, partial [Acinetobacter baumannii]